MNKEKITHYKDGSWLKQVFDQYGNKIYSESSDGYWAESKFDENNNLILYQDSHGNREIR